MRRISIIWKVTIWYTIFLCILAVMVVSVTYLVSERILSKSSKSHLISVVDNLAEEMEYDDGVLEADDDIDFLDHGVYLSIYDGENEILMGMLPKSYDSSRVFPPETLQKITILKEEWYVYDRYKEVGGFGIIKIRGMMQADTQAVNHSVSSRVLLVLSPMIILVATVGGYLLTRKAFRPVNEMRRTVEQISSGKDLTRRVNLGKGEDELYKLANTFDQMFERLEDAFEREKQFSSDVSHELRTPVSVILSQCEYAMEQENAAEIDEALKSIYHQTERMSKLIGQLLLLSRSDQAFIKLTLEEVPISELLEVIVEEEREKAEGKNICITTDIEKEIVLQGDETMLVRFFVNLISNAICYGKEDGFIKVELHKEGERVIGQVKDNGIGISKEDQEKIWRRFYQVNSSRTTTKEGNLGLGLSMVRWIVKAHGGEVFVESELGEGSIFSFWFPINGRETETK